MYAGVYALSRACTPVFDVAATFPKKECAGYGYMINVPDSNERAAADLLAFIQAQESAWAICHGWPHHLLYTCVHFRMTEKVVQRMEIFLHLSNEPAFMTVLWTTHAEVY